MLKLLAKNEKYARIVNKHLLAIYFQDGVTERSSD